MSIDRWVLLCLVCLTTFFVDNSVLVPDIMESRNIVTAREMVYDGNWIAPTMNGELRLEKPPLPTWLTAVVEMIAPDNLGWQRGVAGLAALLLVFYFYCFVKNILGVAPFVSALAAGLVAGTIWEFVGPSATFWLGSAFAAAAFVWLLLGLHRRPVCAKS